MLIFGEKIFKIESNKNQKLGQDQHFMNFFFFTPISTSGTGLDLPGSDCGSDIFLLILILWCPISSSISQHYTMYVVRYTYNVVQVFPLSGHNFERRLPEFAHMLSELTIAINSHQELQEAPSALYCAINSLRNNKKKTDIN